MHWRSIRPILIGVPLVLAAWLGSILVLTLFQSAGVPVAVIARGGAAALSAVVAADGYILQVRGDTVIAIADDSGFVGRLYRHGALMVIQTPVGGCMFTPAAAGGVREASAAPRSGPAI